MALGVVALALLGFFGLQARSAVDGVEGQQRAQALQLVQDMSQRMAINRAGTRAGHYLRADIGLDPDCPRPPLPAGLAPGGVDAGAFELAMADLCDWHTQIRAAWHVPPATRSQVRGCISTTARPDEFQIALLWPGQRPGADTVLGCADGQAAPAGLQRGVATALRLGRLL